MKIMVIFYSLFLCTNAFAISEFTPRTYEDCTTINNEMTDWFLAGKKDYYDVVTDKFGKKTVQLIETPMPPIESKMGVIRKQGDIGWCFAHAAADMLSFETGFYLSSAQIAKNYYLKSHLAWLWGGKERGFINSAIDLSLDQPLCEEKNFTSTGVDLDMAKNMECKEPVITINNLTTKTFLGIESNADYSIYNNIDRILQAGHIAGIHYSANVAYFNEKNNIINIWTNHASTVVARYFDKRDNLCRYIIRNTWGETCMRTKTPNVQCLKGYYSLPESVLNESLNEVIELKVK